MKNLADIKNRSDIEKLIDEFYRDVKTDDLIGHFFTQLNWEKHLPIMYNFWENVLFYSGNYNGNPMEQHKYLHQKMVMTKAHFDRWTYLFNKTVDSLYSGTNAELIKEKAQNIGAIMQLKIIP